MIRQVLLTALLAGCCVEATLKHLRYQDVYKDDHDNVLPTDPIKEGYLERLRRSSEDTDETYDDDWMNFGDSKEESETFLYQDETELVQLAERRNTVRTKKQGTVENPVVAVKYSIGKILEPGDFIEVHGTYSAATSFSVNILDGSGRIMFHIKPIPNKATYTNKATLMNSRPRAGWGSEVRCELPSLKTSEDFVMRIVLMDNVYKTYFNGNSLSETFPYREKISAAKDILLDGGHNGFTWNRLILPGTEKAFQYTGMKEFQLKVGGLKERIAMKVAGKNLREVKAYVNSNEGSLAVLQWWLTKQMQDKAEFFDFNDGTLDWIVTNRESLEMLMTSGDIRDNKYRQALKILEELIQIDPAIKKEPL